MSILVYLEQVEGVIKKSSFEAVSYAKAVAEKEGGSVIAIALGKVEDDELKKAGGAGAEKVLHAKDERLSEGNIQAHAQVVAAAFEKIGADTLVLAKSSLGDAVAARLAVKMNAALVSNVVELPDTSAGYKVKRSIFTGKAFAVTDVLTNNKILAIQKNVVEIESGGTDAVVEPFETDLDETVFTAKITNVEKASGDVLLPEADIVVSGGRGLKG